MIIGTPQNIQARLRALLPSEWFPPGALPVLNTVLAAISGPLSSIYFLFQYAWNQMRLATSAGPFIDLFAFDFFGFSFLRRPGEGDAPFAARIAPAIFAPKVTRAAMVSALTTLTGRAPVIFEPFYPPDTGAYDVPTMGYGVAGGYGSYALPAQVFVTVHRPQTAGNPYVGGYGNTPGGYGVGQLEYITPSLEAGTIENQEIYDTILRTKAAGVTVWTNISD